MQDQWKQLGDDLEGLKDDVRTLLAATREATDEKVVSARTRIISSMERARDVAQERAQEAQHYIRRHPRETSIIAGLAGVALALLIFGRCGGRNSCECD